MENNTAEELQTKECAVCGEPFIDDQGDVVHCPLCLEYEKIFDETMEAVVDRTANRWKFKPDQITVASRTITREEWEASGKNWFLTWEDEFERLMKVCCLDKINHPSGLRLLLVRMCDDKHGVLPIHAFQILANILRQNPKVYYGWESDVKYFMRTKKIKFCWRTRKFNWTDKYVVKYHFEAVEKFIYPKYFNRQFVPQFNPWQHLIKMHRNFAEWLKTFAVIKGDIVKVKKISLYRGKPKGERIESIVQNGKVIQRLLTIEFSQGIKDFFKGDHPYAVAVREAIKARKELREKIRKENEEKREAKRIERLERQREQQAAYRERKKALKEAMRRAEEYATEKFLKENPMDDWPEVDE